MHLIIGGKYMGKLRYAKRLYGEDVPICDLADAMPEAMFAARVVVNLQDGVRHMLKLGEAARDFFALNFFRLEDKVLIGDEIGSGIVPLDPFERLWRDETGFLYQMLAARAALVDRIWAGLPFRLKG
ncbi:MAG: bifunctional adenosylcobinamide kinase/adenosylcobinamide-phosphate guanylyltransferase [Synergistaceae bacterium]|jgi:adenosyl cobinamide kinase/adenosyl cobinamide phosphate guanylyltransferase|nr:bifunctional adenosylcobinamide kinase/adenosylcobinamide-phosphate guanylyltransferase [Synergistaceae bacterium]